jgi:hypothetical protein
MSRRRLSDAFATRIDSAGESRSTYQSAFHQAGTTTIASPRNTARSARSANFSGSPCVIWSSARARASRTVAASSCAACRAPGNSWRWIATARGRDRQRQSWHQCRPPAAGPRCAARTSPWRRSPGGHRGSCAGWPASPRPPTADEQRCVEPQRGLRPHAVRNSDGNNVKAGCQTGLGLGS